MQQHIIEAAHQDQSALKRMEGMVFEVLARKHDFKLPGLSTAEANRMLGFIENMKQGEHAEFKDWTPVMFTAAVQGARISLAALLATSPLPATRT